MAVRANPVLVFVAVAVAPAMDAPDHFAATMGTSSLKMYCFAI